MSSAAICVGGEGRLCAGAPGLLVETCRYVQINWANFHGGGHTLKCHASHGDEGGFYTYSASGPNGSSAICYYGYPGRSVWATVDGVASPPITW